MKSNVLVKLSARNSRIPIDLFRSIEYTIRLQHKQQQQHQASANKHQATSSSTTVATNATTTTTTTATSSSVASPRVVTIAPLGNMPQRGAFIHLPGHSHMRPKSKLLNRAKLNQQRENQHRANLSRMVRQERQLVKPNDVDLDDEQQTTVSSGDSSGSSGDRDNVSVHPIVVGANQNLVIMNAIDLKSLELLEDKMKKWQLELGVCKKAFVTKMNRIVVNEV